MRAVLFVLKLGLKILAAPVVLALMLFTWLCFWLLYVSSFIIGLVSTVNQVAFPTWQPERCAELLASLGYPAVTGRVSTGDWFAVKGQRAEWIRGTFSPLLTEMEGGASAQVCLRNGVRLVSVKSVSDHLFSDSQAEEYFDFGQALEALGRAVLPLAKALQKAGR